MFEAVTDSAIAIRASKSPRNSTECIMLILKRRNPPSAAGKTAVVELPRAAAVEPDRVNYFNKGKVPLVSSPRLPK